MGAHPPADRGLIKKRIDLFPLLVLLGLAGLGFFYAWIRDVVPLPRGRYSPVNLNEISIIAGLESDALTPSEDVFLSGSEPEAIALQIAGYPNVDRISPEQVRVFEGGHSNRIYVITAYGMMDDSVRDKEYRVDLVWVDGEWEVAWAGWRQRCQRGLVFGWTKGLCP